MQRKFLLSGFFALCIILLLGMMDWQSVTARASILTIKTPVVMSLDNDKEERTKVAKAILELHELYISTGEEKKPMTISLPDLAAMANLSKEATERILVSFIEEKLIQVEKSAITILDKRKLKKVAS